VLYCLGPHNLWADSFACISALTQGDAHAAGEKLKALFGIAEIQDAQSLHKQLLSNIFIQSNRRVFGVIFWYAILGPAGALLYRTASLSAVAAPEQEGAAVNVTQPAHFVESVLNWLPVRVFTFIFALGGHFARVLSTWRKKALLGLNSSDDMLAACGIAALGNEEEAAVAEDGSMEKEAISLLDRVFVITLVIVAVVVMVG
jgi:AmpE protein